MPESAELLICRFPHMPTISLETAERLTGLSRRTLWRRVARGVFKGFGRQESVHGHGPRISLAVVLEDIPATLEPGDEDIFLRADQGDPEAQNDVGLIFMEEERYDLALPWLQLAAEQEYPDAMHWVGRCYIAGHGVDKDDNLGLSWIKRAAKKGHLISQRQIESLGGDS